MPTADLGWAMARCIIEDDPAAASLTLMEPEGDDTPAKSLDIVGLDSIIALRDFINETLTAYEDATTRKEPTDT